MNAGTLRVLLNVTDAERSQDVEQALWAVLGVLEDQEHELKELRQKIETLERRAGREPGDDGFRFG